MTLNHHILSGCNPTPLASYLKALGVLRIIAEQLDSQCRGWWQDEQFHLLTTKTKEEIEQFFLEQYEPTPVFNPWGGRSGFYKESSEKTARLALTFLEDSGLSNFATFRSVIKMIRERIAIAGDKKPVDDDANELARDIRRRIRGPAIDWLDTVVVDLEERLQGPPIFGTKGNEGSGSYTAAYYAALINCFFSTERERDLRATLWDNRGSERTAWIGSFQVPSTSNKKGVSTESVAAPFRQLLPSGAGDCWYLALAFEGAMMLQSGVVRRSSSSRSKYTSSPFFFAPLGAGSGASSEFDEFVMNKGAKNPGRGEQWMPLWSSPTTYRELKSIFKDSRCSSGKTAAEQPLDAVLAIASRGIDLGISTFIRYGYLQRDNQTLHLAVPLGRLDCKGMRDARFTESLTLWTEKLRKLARSKTTTGKLIVAHRQLAGSLFEAIGSDNRSKRLQSVLRCCVAVESLQKTGTALDAGPIPSLQPAWLRAIDDGSVELRLAIALASAASGYSQRGWQIDSIRGHWLPLKPGRFAKFNTSDKRLLSDPRVVMKGHDFLRDCIAVVERRIIEAERNSQRNLPLSAYPRCGATLEDIEQFIAGNVDDQKIYDLSRGLMALQWDQLDREHLPDSMIERAHDRVRLPDDAWITLRLVHLPRALRDGKRIPVEPSIIRLLQSNMPHRAMEIAIRRLRSVGIRPTLRFAITDESTCRRWAAALVFPLSPGSIQRAAEIVDPSLKGIKVDA